MNKLYSLALQGKAAWRRPMPMDDCILYVGADTDNHDKEYSRL